LLTALYVDWDRVEMTFKCEGCGKRIRVANEYNKGNNVELAKKELIKEGWHFWGGYHCYCPECVKGKKFWNKLFFKALKILGRR